MDIDLEGNIVILDEGHNIEDVSRDAASFNLSDVDLDRIITALKRVTAADDADMDHRTLLLVRIMMTCCVTKMGIVG